MCLCIQLKLHYQTRTSLNPESIKKFVKHLYYLKSYRRGERINFFFRSREALSIFSKDLSDFIIPSSLIMFRRLNIKMDFVQILPITGVQKEEYLQ